MVVLSFKIFIVKFTMSFSQCSFPENLCQIIAFKLLEDVTKYQFVQSPVTLVINIQSQNEYKCTQDVFRVLN